MLERKYQLELKSCEYLSLGELMKELHRNSPKLQDFQKAIGCDGSLQYPIAQLKTALSYPQEDYLSFSMGKWDVENPIWYDSHMNTV